MNILRDGIEDKHLFYLLSNPDNIINNENKIERNLLKEYLIKKFDLYNEFILDTLYEDILNYINNIDIDYIIVEKIVYELIDKING
jgi:hypothetical protein